VTNPSSDAVLGTLKTSNFRNPATYCSSTLLRSCEYLSASMFRHCPLGRGGRRVVPEASLQFPG
jgi:hypothetical protein